MEKGSKKPEKAPKYPENRGQKEVLFLKKGCFWHVNVPKMEFDVPK